MRASPLWPIPDAIALTSVWPTAGGRDRYITPAAAISFMFYEQFKALLHMYTTGDKNSLNNNFIFKHPAVPLVAGGLARLLGTACRTPFDVLRQRLQVQGSLLNSEFKA